MTIFRLSIPSLSSLDCLQSAFSLKIRHVRWLRQRAWSTVSLAVTLQRKVRDSLRTAEKSSLQKIAFLRRGKRRPEMHLLFARRKARGCSQSISWPDPTTPQVTQDRRSFKSLKRALTTFFLLQVNKTCLYDVCMNSIDVLFRLCVAFERLNKKTANIWRWYHCFPSQMSAVFSG